MVPQLMVDILLNSEWLKIEKGNHTNNSLARL